MLILIDTEKLNCIQNDGKSHCDACALAEFRCPIAHWENAPKELIMCKNCNNWTGGNKQQGICIYQKKFKKENDFCEKATKKK